MTPIIFLLILIGVSYTAWQFTRFIVWLDAADEVDDVPDACELSMNAETDDARRHDAA